MVDKVKPLKLENPSTGGTETDSFPTETNTTEDYLACYGVALENSDSYLIDHTKGGLSTNMSISFYPVIGSAREIYIAGVGENQVSDLSTDMVYTGAPDEIYQVNFGSEEEPDWRDYRGTTGEVTLKSRTGSDMDAGGSGHAGNSGNVLVTTGNGGVGDTVGGDTGAVTISTGYPGNGTGGVGTPGWIYINPGDGNTHEDGGSFSGQAHTIIRGGNAAPGYAGTTGGNTYIYGGNGEVTGRTILGFEPFAAYTSETHIGANGSSQGNYSLHNWSNLYNSGLVNTTQLLATSLTANKAIYADASKILVSSTTSGTELGYVTGVTSAIQTQLNSKQSTTLTNAHILVGNGSNVATDVAVTGDVTISNTGVTAIGTGKVTSTMILDGTILNADVNASAAIAYSKLAAMTSANILLGSSGNVPTVTAVTGDVTISNTGVTAIGTGKVTSTMILDGTILNADVNASAAIDYSKLAALTGDVTISGNVSAIGSGKVTSTMILDGTILNADINASAAIAFSKMAALTAGKVPYSDGSGFLTTSSFNYDGSNLAVGGTINSSYKLYVNGSQLVEVPGGATTSLFRVVDVTVGDAVLMYQGGNKYVLLGPGDHGEKVGIGTYGPTESLHLGTGNFLHEAAGSGATRSHVLSNTSNTASSKAMHQIKVAGGTADDPYLRFTVNGVTEFTTGIDNSDSDKFKISRASTLGTNDALTIDSSNNVVTTSLKATDNMVVPYDTSTVPSLSENGAIKIGPATGGDSIFFQSGGTRYFVNYTGSF